MTVTTVVVVALSVKRRPADATIVRLFLSAVEKDSGGASALVPSANPAM
jgi:hypothetical protein